MYVRCKKHDEVMHEILEGESIIPFCISCIAEKRVEERLREEALIESQKVSLTFKFLVHKAADVLLNIVNFIFAFLIIGSMCGLVAGFAVLFIGGILIELIGGDSTVLGDNLIVICVTLGIIIPLAFILKMKHSKKKEDNLKLNPLDRLQLEIDRISNSATYHHTHVARYKNQLRKEYEFITAGIDKIDIMSGLEFEDYISFFFEELGYKVVRTPTTGDEGIDLIIDKNGLRVGVQCKRYNGKVSVSAIQEAYAGKDMHDCDEALVVTNSLYTAPAIKMAEKLNVALWNRNDLIRELMQVRTPEISWNEFVKNYYNFKKVNKVSI
ncbi:restriction endonuclease [Paenibacillus polymyxa]|uniref:restriction endonuclease n=1 Tax=Paenibacillus polymyxa TaxID=1406 RepID=UPI002024330B|nr:restriction endonuclease [Paenibacillus polymyxa]URJ47377.1 restriction endonuclease [Paenibacillus polymyxa]